MSTFQPGDLVRLGPYGQAWMLQHVEHEDAYVTTGRASRRVAVASLLPVEGDPTTLPGHHDRRRREQFLAGTDRQAAGSGSQPVPQPSANRQQHDSSTPVRSFVFHLADPSEMQPGEDVRIVERDQTVFVIVRGDLDRRTCNLEVSVAVTRYLRSSWLYVGTEEAP